LTRTEGIRLSEHIDGEGAIIFESKRRDFPYRSGRVKSWIKVKNPASPAMLRVLEDRAAW
jgi:ATP-dependent DNA ligase